MPGPPSAGGRVEWPESCATVRPWTCAAALQMGALVSRIMAVIVWAFALSLMLVAAMDVGGQVSGQERRSCFGLRVVLTILCAPAALSILLGGAALRVVPEQTSIFVFVLMILCSPALLLVPSVL